MSNETSSSTKGLSTASYVIAVICLGLGISIGYLIRGGSPQQPATDNRRNPSRAAGGR